MLGWLTKDNQNPVVRNVPSENRSQFSLERYKFFLEAPFEISNRCCNVMKKNPAHLYHKQTGRNPIIATMAEESKLRTQKWLENGCNGFNLTIPTSNPMSFWTEQDVLLYIELNKHEMLKRTWRKMPRQEEIMKYGNRLVYRKTGATAYYYPNEYRAICSVYGDIVVDYKAEGQLEGQMRLDDLDASKFGIFDLKKPMYKTTGCNRTGCVLCGFGCHLEKEGEERFLRLKETHPKFHNLLNVAKNNDITYAQAIDWINEHGNMNIKY